MGDIDEPIKLTQFQKHYLESQLFGSLDLGGKRAKYQRWSDAEIEAFAVYFGEGGGEKGSRRVEGEGNFRGVDGIRAGSFPTNNTPKRR